MIELDSEIEAALEVWFKQELDRAWKQYDSGAFARAMIPPGSSREEELALGRSLLNGDAQTQLGLLEADYHRGDYSSARSASRLILSSLMTPPFDEGDQRFAALSKRVLEAIAEVQEARVRWAAGGM